MSAEAGILPMVFIILPLQSWKTVSGGVVTGPRRASPRRNAAKEVPTPPG